MKPVDYLIVGGSAAGTTAADVIRTSKSDATIAVVTDEPHGFYSRVLLPHYVRHKVDREHVIIKKPEWYGQRNIDLLTGVSAQRLEVSKKTVTLSNGEEYQYGKLLISVGGKTIPFSAPGAELENILYLRTLEDADKIIKVASQSQKGVIIGGGFIGLEFASCFKANGINDVTVLVMEPYFWFGKLDEKSSMVLTATLEKNGIKVLMEEEVEKFEGEGAVSSVLTKTGRRYETQVVGVGIGIKPDLDWIKESGISVNRGIVTNEYLETNVGDIYAAGDCAEFNDVIFERQHILGNWANATNQGRTVARTMCGQRTVFETASSYTTNFFDGSCSFIGETDPKFADEIINRGSVEGGKMTQVYIKTIGGKLRIVGATAINNPTEVATLTAIIKNRVDVSRFKEKLSDINFNLIEVVN